MRYCTLHKKWYAFDYCPDCLAPVIPVLDSKTIDPEYIDIDQPSEADILAGGLMQEIINREQKVVDGLKSKGFPEAEPLKPDDQDELWNEALILALRGRSIEELKSKYHITPKQ